MPTDGDEEGTIWLDDAFHRRHPEIGIEDIVEPDGDIDSTTIRADCGAGGSAEAVDEAAVESILADHTTPDRQTANLRAACRVGARAAQP